MVDTYFIGCGAENEYQVWGEARIVYRNSDPNNIIDYMVNVYKKAKGKIILHTIPPVQGVEEQIQKALEKNGKKG